MKHLIRNLSIISCHAILFFTGCVSTAGTSVLLNDSTAVLSQSIQTKSIVCSNSNCNNTVNSHLKDTLLIIPKRHEDVLLLQNKAIFYAQHEIDSILNTYEMALITTNKEDSVFCSQWMPKIAFDGTEYNTDMYFRSPRARPLDESSGSIQFLVKSFFLNLKCDDENEKPIFTSINLIIDEKGHCRGLYFYLEKDKRECALYMAREVFSFVKVKLFCPAIDIKTGEPIPDIMVINLADNYNVPQN